MTFQNTCANFKLIEKLNVFSKLSVRIVFLSLLTVIYLFLPISVANAQTTSNDPAYPVCYFGQRWEWGLHTANTDDWQALSGNWRKDNGTGVWKFFTSTSRSEVEQSCENAKIVKNIPGNRTAIYAAVSKNGKNYEIVYQ